MCSGFTCAQGVHLLQGTGTDLSLIKHENLKKHILQNCEILRAWGKGPGKRVDRGCDGAGVEGKDLRNDAAGRGNCRYLRWWYTLNVVSIWVMLPFCWLHELRKLTIVSLYVSSVAMRNEYCLILVFYSGFKVGTYQNLPLVAVTNPHALGFACPVYDRYPQADSSLSYFSKLLKMDCGYLTDVGVTTLWKTLGISIAMSPIGQLASLRPGQWKEKWRKESGGYLET